MSNVSRDDNQVPCPLTGKPFNCNTCKAVDGKTGLCPYMELDNWVDKTLRTMRKLFEV